MDEQWATGKRETGAGSLVLFDPDYFKPLSGRNTFPDFSG